MTATETIKTSSLQVGDIIREINPLTKEVTESVVAHVTPFTIDGTKKWRVSFNESDKYGWVHGAGRRWYRVVN